MTTEDNLKAAFAGESQARNKYDYFAKAARKEGYHYIANIFEETARNEHQHAKDEFRLLNGIGTTAENLKGAIDGEHQVEYILKSRVLRGGDIVEEFEIAPGGDGLCMAIHGWWKSEFWSDA